MPLGDGSTPFADEPSAAVGRAAAQTFGVDLFRHGHEEPLQRRPPRVGPRADEVLAQRRLPRLQRAQVHDVRRHRTRAVAFREIAAVAAVERDTQPLENRLPSGVLARARNMARSALRNSSRGCSPADRGCRRLEPPTARTCPHMGYPLWRPFRFNLLSVNDLHHVRPLSTPCPKPVHPLSETCPKPVRRTSADTESPARSLLGVGPGKGKHAVIEGQTDGSVRTNPSRKPARNIEHRAQQTNGQ